MDNNQQGKDGGVQQPAAATTVTEGAGPQAALDSAGKKDLGVNSGTPLNVASPFTGSDVSMTAPQVRGGNITTTEVGSK